MRKATWIAAIAAVVGMAPSTARAQDTTQILIQIAAQMLGERFGLTSDEVLFDSQFYGTSVYDMPPAYSISEDSQADVMQILRLRQAGYSWPVVASLSGVGYDDYREAYYRGDYDTDRYWEDELSDYYETPSPEVRKLRRAGASWSEAMRAISISRRTGVNPLTVYNSYAMTGRWDVIYTGRGQNVPKFVYVDGEWMRTKQADFRAQPWNSSYTSRWQYLPVVYTDSRPYGYYSEPYGYTYAASYPRRVVEPRWSRDWDDRPSYRSEYLTPVYDIITPRGAPWYSNSRNRTQPRYDSRRDREWYENQRQREQDRRRYDERRREWERERQREADRRRQRDRDRNRERERDWDRYLAFRDHPVREYERPAQVRFVATRDTDRDDGRRAQRVSGDWTVKETPATTIRKKTDQKDGVTTRQMIIENPAQTIRKTMVKGEGKPEKKMIRVRTEGRQIIRNDDRDRRLEVEKKDRKPQDKRINEKRKDPKEKRAQLQRTTSERNRIIRQNDREAKVRAEKRRNEEAKMRLAAVEKRRDSQARAKAAERQAEARERSKALNRKNEARERAKGLDRKNEARERSKAVDRKNEGARERSQARERTQKQRERIDQRRDRPENRPVKNDRSENRGSKSKSNRGRSK